MFNFDMFEDVYILKISKNVENFRFQGFISKMVNKLCPETLTDS